jgi:NADH-quinone oxidoreductase subunit C
MDPAAILQRLQDRFGPRITGSQLDVLDPWIEVAAEALPEVGRYLRDEPELRFQFLHCITSVDYFEPDAKKAAKVDWQPHLEVVYHLSSLVHRHRLVLKVLLPRWKDDRAGQLPEVPSVAGIWSTADWHEREVFDLGGVRFIGHPDLRRILCPEDWVGHPLRKDYVMPEEYHGIPARGPQP